MTCPFCDTNNAQLISLFGSQLLLSQYRCRACGTYFEGLREDRDDEANGNASAPAADPS